MSTGCGLSAPVNTKSIVMDRHSTSTPPHGEYGNLINDYMFKRIFGREETKDILITFLNHIIGEGDIEDVSFQNVEHLGPTREDSKVIFDVCVRTSREEEFIVEMQLVQQKYFKDRALYYLSYPILGQGALAKQKGRRKASVRKPFRWNYELKPVKLIAILNFSMEHEEGRW